MGHAGGLDRAPHPQAALQKFPGVALIEPRRRAEQALIAVVADCYLAGVSTRRVDKLVKTLGIDGILKPQVSRLATSLDEVVEQFRSRPLDQALHLPVDRRARGQRRSSRVWRQLVDPLCTQESHLMKRTSTFTSPLRSRRGGR